MVVKAIYTNSFWNARFLLRITSLKTTVLNAFSLLPFIKSKFLFYWYAIQHFIQKQTVVAICQMRTNGHACVNDKVLIVFWNTALPTINFKGAGCSGITSHGRLRRVVDWLMETMLLSNMPQWIEFKRDFLFSAVRPRSNDRALLVKHLKFVLRATFHRSVTSQNIVLLAMFLRNFNNNFCLLKAKNC